MKIYMGRRYSRNAAAARAALAANKERGDAAMKQALADVEAAGRALGKRMLEKREEGR